VAFREQFVHVDLGVESYINIDRRLLELGSESGVDNKYIDVAD
jgi:hypothetical protein